MLLVIPFYYSSAQKNSKVYDANGLLVNKNEVVTKSNVPSNENLSTNVKAINVDGNGVEIKDSKPVAPISHQSNQAVVTIQNAKNTNLDANGADRTEVKVVQTSKGSVETKQKYVSHNPSKVPTGKEAARHTQAKPQPRHEGPAPVVEPKGKEAAKHSYVKPQPRHEGPTPVEKAKGKEAERKKAK